MNVMLPVSGPPATPIPLGRDPAAAILAAANLLLPHLERGAPVDTAMLRAAMETAFGASDATGAWDWKLAYEAGEVATVLFLRKYGKALFRKAASPAARLSVLAKIATLLPTHTRRSEESQAMQQFSTPLPLGLAALTAAATTPADRVLEPSAGTGLLAILAETAAAAPILNELAATRADLLASLFPALAVTRFDAAQIDDHLDPGAVPSVVLMNSPFSAMAKVAGRVADAGLRHVTSALARLAPGGRLVAITGANVGPDLPGWREAFVRLQETGTVLFSAAVAGSVYAKHGTSFATRLTVIDKRPASDPTLLPASIGMAPDVATLLGWIEAHVPPRLPVALPPVPSLAVAPPRGVATWLRARSAAPAGAARAKPSALDIIGVELAYETVDWTPPEGAHLTDAIYEPYGLQSIRFPGAQAHPTKLVQSAAMASIAPPKPSYRPLLPAAVVTDGLLSDAQLETVIQAGEAHGEHLPGAWDVDKTFDAVSAARDDAEASVRFRRGYMLGDGTGCGKGRQVAGILVDNWLRGRRKAVWISKSDKLLEDAQRDVAALGLERLLVTPLSRFPQGRPIALSEGILFTTYATLRSDDRGEKLSRVKQIVEWLSSDFDGVIVFDESHAMQNAAGATGERGDTAPSQQGRAGLRLQHALPDARVVYVSATGATTVHNLAYAQRLGLWGGEDFPFTTRAEFVAAIEDGGVAAMEVLARDLKALGLYTARSLSYDGVEYELVEHRLTEAQRRIYDSYAEAFAIIHNNLDAAMQAANITGSDGTLIAASGGFIAIAVAIGMSVWRAREAKRVETYGSARWAETAEVKSAGLLGADGVLLGQLDRAYLRHDGPEHVLCFAPTRSGKGVGLVVPTLLTWPGSAIVHDIKGENWQLTAGFRARHGRVLLFDPTNAASAAYNPLLEVRRGEWEIRDIQNIADILVDPEGSLEKRNHWEKTGHSLLVGAILHVLYAEADKTLAGVAAFLSDPKRSIEATLQAMMTTPHLGATGVHPVVASTGRELLNKSDNERSGVLSTAMSFLGLYRDPVVAEVTRRCDWRIADLVADAAPATLYLVVPPSDIARTKPLIRLVLNQIGRRLTEDLHAKQRKHRVLMMLDEFPALGRLDFFESALAFMAGYGLKAFLIAQSLNQIEKAYGANNSILDNCHVRVSFAANDERTAKRVSDALGTATEMKAQKNYAGHRLSPWLGHLMVSRSETARPLLTPGEVMQLPPADEIVMVAGTPPIRAKKARYYEDARFKERVLPPPDPAKSARSKRADGWSTLAPIQPDAALLAAARAAEADKANAGLRREPELPEHVAIVAESAKAPADEFAVMMDDEEDDAARQARAMRQQMRGLARQVSLDPADGMEL